MKPLTFANAQEWREWLEQHHGQEDGVWLTIRKKGSPGPGVYLDDAVDEALCFGWINGQQRSRDARTYTQWFSQRRQGSLWSLINKNRALSLIEEGRMAEAGLAKIEEAKQNGRWAAAYTSRERLPVPPDLSEALKQNPTAWENFRRFSPSVQTNYVGWVEEAKRPETRERRIAQVVVRAEQNKKPGIA